MKKNNHNNHNRGFTIIETLIYLALFAILIGGAVVAAYSLLEGGGRTQTRTLIQEEGNFLVSKINWALSGAESVEILAVNKLSVTKWDPTYNPVVIEWSGGNMAISKNGAVISTTLNNADISVNNLNFVHNYSSGTNPESVSFSFTLTSKTPNGMTISQDFSGEKYIRK